MFWEDIFTINDLHNWDLEELTYVLSASSFQELTEFLAKNDLALIHGDIQQWAYSKAEAESYAGIDYFSLDGKFCLVCEKEVPSGRKVCDDCYSPNRVYEWCVGCDAPDSLYCQKCAAKKKTESLANFETIRNARRRITDSDFPQRYLRQYKVSEEDRVWGETYVQGVLEAAWLHWDNRQEIRNKRILPVPAAASRWQSKFPDFEKEVREWSFAEEDPGASGLSTAWILAILFGITLWLLPISFILVKRAQKKQWEQYRPGYSPRPFRTAEDEFIMELASYIGESADRQINRKLSMGGGESSDEWATAVSGLWQPLAPRPQLPQRDLTPKEAEEFVTGLLKYFGFEGTKTTRYSKDGGIDVESHHLVVQVKHQVAPVGVKVVREIFGVAASHNKFAAVFAKVGYTREAIEFAEKTGVLLYSYTPSLKGSTAKSTAGISQGILAVLDI